MPSGISKKDVDASVEVQSQRICNCALGPRREPSPPGMPRPHSSKTCFEFTTFSSILPKLGLTTMVKRSKSPHCLRCFPSWLCLLPSEMVTPLPLLTMSRLSPPPLFRPNVPRSSARLLRIWWRLRILLGDSSLVICRTSQEALWLKSRLSPM
ncbi:hypothetical protein ACFX1Q_005603 [Malus domestica]